MDFSEPVALARRLLAAPFSEVSSYLRPTIANLRDAQGCAAPSDLKEEMIRLADALEAKQRQGSYVRTIGHVRTIP